MQKLLFREKDIVTAICGCTDGCLTSWLFSWIMIILTSQSPIIGRIENMNRRCGLQVKDPRQACSPSFSIFCRLKSARLLPPPDPRLLSHLSPSWPNLNSVSTGSFDEKAVGRQLCSFYLIFSFNIFTSTSSETRPNNLFDLN